ncbi:MAG: alkaline phosphatase family protein, partial [Gemmatimonadota bacterium]
MPRLLFLVALSSAVVPVACREPQKREDVSLVVVLIVDQLRPEQLERYDAAFTGGLRRLLDEGHQFEQAVHDHALTWTSPGHASLATGLHPRRHGI